MSRPKSYLSQESNDYFIGLLNDQLRVRFEIRLKKDIKDLEIRTGERYDIQFPDYVRLKGEYINAIEKLITLYN